MFPIHQSECYQFNEKSELLKYGPSLDIVSPMVSKKNHQD